MPALNKWPCVYLLDGAGVTGCIGSLYSFTAGNTKLGVFYVNFLGTFDQLYFHLGAMHWDSADTPLSGTRDPTGGLCGYPSVGPTGMGTLRLSLLGTLWLSLCHPLLSSPSGPEGRLGALQRA